MKTMKFQTKCAFDPEYGHEVLPRGTECEIEFIKIGVRAEIRLVTANGKRFPGWGYLLSNYQLNAYFTQQGVA